MKTQARYASLLPNYLVAQVEALTKLNSREAFLKATQPHSNLFSSRKELKPADLIPELNDFCKLVDRAASQQEPNLSRGEGFTRFHHKGTMVYHYNTHDLGLLLSELSQVFLSIHHQRAIQQRKQYSPKSEPHPDQVRNNHRALLVEFPPSQTRLEKGRGHYVSGLAGYVYGMDQALKQALSDGDYLSVTEPNLQSRLGDTPISPYKVAKELNEFACLVAKMACQAEPAPHQGQAYHHESGLIIFHYQAQPVTILLTELVDWLGSLHLQRQEVEQSSQWSSDVPKVAHLRAIRTNLEEHLNTNSAEGRVTKTGKGRGTSNRSNDCQNSQKGA